MHADDIDGFTAAFDGEATTSLCLNASGVAEGVVKGAKLTGEALGKAVKVGTLAGLQAQTVFGFVRKEKKPEGGSRF